MEEDEMQMTKEELQKWIKEKVKSSKLISTDVREKSKLLQSLLERREKQAAHLLKLCQSVAACEAIVKKQYSLLGWEYRDTDSDDDVTVCGNTPPTPRELKRDNGIQNFINPKRKPVVALTRLSKGTIRSLCSSARQNHYSEDGSPVNLRDSDCKPRPSKRRKIDPKNKTIAESHATPKAGTIPASQACTNTSAKSEPMETSALPASTSGETSASIKALESTEEDTKPFPGISQGPIIPNMIVLARMTFMCWKPGKVKEIRTRDDGRLKYKIKFDEKGKRLVSGHHIAFPHSPNVNQLFVGARVVVECQDPLRFFPGILAECPNTKNQMRYLVFMDDHTPIYVPLRALHLVCRPLTDPLDDVPDGMHKNFMKNYMKTWPFPPRALYKTGQTFNALFEGVLQKCKVLEVDSTLIHVVFEKDQHKEWIYRGSMRLEHMINMKEHLVQKKKRSAESSKSAQ